MGVFADVVFCNLRHRRVADGIPGAKLGRGAKQAQNQQYDFFHIQILHINVDYSFLVTTKNVGIRRSWLWSKT